MCDINPIKQICHVCEEPKNVKIFDRKNENEKLSRHLIPH